MPGKAWENKAGTFLRENNNAMHFIVDISIDTTDFFFIFKSVVLCTPQNIFLCSIHSLCFTILLEPARIQVTIFIEDHGVSHLNFRYNHKILFIHRIKHYPPNENNIRFSHLSIYHWLPLVILFTPVYIQKTSTAF